MTGEPGQLDWAQQIKPRVEAEFDRVAKAFAEVAAKQTGHAQADTLEMIAVLEEKRAAVMANPSAGYFVSHWRELNDQVRLLLAADPRFKAIQARRTARSLAAPPTQPFPAS